MRIFLVAFGALYSTPRLVGSIRWDRTLQFSHSFETKL